MNKLSTQDSVQILNALSEGIGINAASRITGKSKNTILKLLADAGAACAQYQDSAMRNLTIKKVQVDEIWSFVGAKQANVQANNEAHADYGDCYTFTAIDPEIKLMPCWLVGTRTKACAFDFMADLAPRLANRVQLLSDGFLAHPNTVRLIATCILQDSEPGVFSSRHRGRKHGCAAVGRLTALPRALESGVRRAPGFDNSGAGLIAATDTTQTCRLFEQCRKPAFTQQWLPWGERPLRGAVFAAANSGAPGKTALCG